MDRAFFYEFKSVEESFGSGVLKAREERGVGLGSKAQSIDFKENELDNSRMMDLDSETI